MDAARHTDELNRINSLLGRNATSPFPSDVPLLPSIDICTLEFPENYTSPPPHISSLRVNACNLRKSQDHNRLQAEREKFERLATLPELLATSSSSSAARHIRHHRQQHFDPRSKIINKKVLTDDEVQALNLKNLTRTIR